MKKNYSFLLKGVVLLLLNVIQMEGISQQPLRPGDKLPKIQITSFLNHKDLSVSLESPGKKLIILDFWSTWCKACIPALKKLDSLQKIYKKDLEIIAVTDQSADIVQSFFKKIKLELSNLRIKTDDKQLKAYFPYQSLPHTVWISEGKVEYITYMENVNMRVIENFLNGERPVLSFKDGLIEYAVDYPIWDVANAALDKKPERYSYMSGWLPNYGGTIFKFFKNDSLGTNGLRFINVSLVSVIREAFGQDFQYRNRVVIESDRANFILWSKMKAIEVDEERRLKNKVCYELSIGKEDRSRMKEIIREDLNRYLDFRMVVEDRSVKSYVIELLAKNSPGEHKECDRTKNGFHDGRYVYCGDISGFAMQLQREFALEGLPIVDRSEYGGTIHLEYSQDIKDIEIVKRLLRKHGFKMTEKEIVLPMLILKDKNSL